MVAERLHSCVLSQVDDCSLSSVSSSVVACCLCFSVTEIRYQEDSRVIGHEAQTSGGLRVLRPQYSAPRQRRIRSYPKAL
jgi:hypothetical protein